MSNLEIAKAYLERQAALNGLGALELTADDAVFQAPTGQILTKDQMKEMYKAGTKRFAGPQTLKIIGTTVEGDRVAIEAVGSAPIVNGKIYENDYHYAIEVKNGVITRFAEYCCTKRPDVIFED